MGTARYLGRYHAGRHEKGGNDEIDAANLGGLMADAQAPLAHKTSHQNGGTDEISVAGLSGELADQQLPKIIDRGDPSGADWTETGDKSVLTTDGSWHPLDCSSIVPAGARFILFRVQIKHGSFDVNFSMRKSGNTYAYNVQTVRIHTPNIINDAHMIIACDTDRKVDYQSSDTPFTLARLIVTGWIF